jgi:hypothetical protein
MWAVLELQRTPQAEIGDTREHERRLRGDAKLSESSKATRLMHGSTSTWQRSIGAPYSRSALPPNGQYVTVPWPTANVKNFVHPEEVLQQAQKSMTSSVGTVGFALMQEDHELTEEEDYIDLLYIMETISVKDLDVLIDSGANYISKIH